MVKVVFFAILLPAFGGLAVGVLYAQPFEVATDIWRPRFQQLTAAHGLSQNFVSGMLQDRRGFMWIATHDGLNRYDGYQFVQYKHDPLDPASLSSNVVMALAEDPEGRLWINTDRGLDRLDPRSATFEHFDEGAGDPPAVALLVDRRGTVWVKVEEELYWLYPDRTGTATHLERVQDVAGNPQLLAEDQQGYVWVSTRTSEQEGSLLYRYAPVTQRFTRYPLPGSMSVTSLLAGRDGQLWISSEEALGLFNAATGVYTRVADLPGVLLVPVPGEEDRFWAVVNYQFGVFDATNGSLRRVPLRAEDEPVRVRQPYVDRTGRLWLATLFDGVFHHDPYARPFVNLAPRTETPVPLASDVVMALHESSDGTLWVGTLGGGLHRFDAGFALIASYRHDPRNPQSLPDDDVWALYEDRTGHLWIGTGAGLCALDLRTGDVTRHAPGTVLAILEGAHGALWLGLTHRTIARYDPGTGALKQYPLGLQPAASSYVGILRPAPSGRLWVGTFDEGLHRFDPATESFMAFPHQTRDGHGLVGKNVVDLHEDPRGRLWLATDQGLAGFDPATESFTAYAERDGLPGNTVYSVVTGGDGHLWLGTARGLVRFTPEAPRGHAFRVFDAADRLRNTEFNRKAALRLRSGALLFGGTEGLTLFDPRAVRTNPHAPPVVLTRFEKTSPKGIEAVALTGLDRLTLTHREYAFRFEFAALDYTNPARNRYAYRLEPFDKEWVEAGTQRTAYYTNLPPGGYVFRVKGSNSDGVWNETGSSVPLTIRPAFWQTWWFRVMAAGVVAGILYAAYRYRVRALLAMERLRLNIARDLHDDIGANLGSIALIGEIVGQREALSEQGRRQLAEVSRVARRMGQDLDDIVWVTNPRYDDLVNLIRKMREVAPGLLGGVGYTFEAPEDDLSQDVDITFRRQVYLIYKEMLHNTARHARATRVSISVEKMNGTLRLSVRDDGVGFDPAEPPPGHGLDNMRGRAEQLGGTLRIDTPPGGGTAVELRAPLP